MADELVPLGDVELVEMRYGYATNVPPRHVLKREEATIRCEGKGRKVSSRSVAEVEGLCRNELSGMARLRTDGPAAQCHAAESCRER